ncbi:unnamed protein product, partial [Ectocarpus fasciculatus]
GYDRLLRPFPVVEVWFVCHPSSGVELGRRASSPADANTVRAPSPSRPVLSPTTSNRLPIPAPAPSAAAAAAAVLPWSSSKPMISCPPPALFPAALKRYRSTPGWRNLATSLSAMGAKRFRGLGLWGTRFTEDG